MLRRVIGMQRGLVVAAATSNVSARNGAGSAGNGSSTAATTTLAVAPSSSCFEQVRGIQSQTNHKGFQPFSAEDEQQLVSVLTSKPKHVGRHVRQMMLTQRKKLAHFRSTVTWLMMQVQRKLELAEIKPEEAAIVIEDVLKECVQLKQSDMAHLLFRAALRFRKYELKITVPSVRYLFESYKARTEGTGMMKTLAEEMKEEPGCRSLAIAAYIFAGLPIEASALRGTVPQSELTTDDYVAMVDGYAKMKLFENVQAIADEVMRMEERPGFDPGIILSNVLIQSSRFEKELAETVFRRCVDEMQTLTDAGIASYIKMRCWNMNSMSEVAALEESILRELRITELGLASSTVLIGRQAEIIVRTHKKGDAVMLTKVEHLQAVVEAQLTNDEIDKIEPDYVVSLIKGYGALGKFEDMATIFESLRKRPGLVNERSYNEMLRWYADGQNVKAVLALKDQMTEEGIFCNPSTYSSVFRCLGKFYPRVVEKQYAELREKGIRPDRHLFAQLVSIFFQLGNMNRVDELWKEMKIKQEHANSTRDGVYTVRSLGTFLRAFKNDSARCAEVVSIATAQGFMQNQGFQAELISHLADTGKHEELNKLLSSLPAKSIATLMSLLRYYGRSDDKERFEAIQKEMRGIEATLPEHVLSVMVQCYARWGDAERVKQILQEVRAQMDGRDSRYYSVAAVAFSRLGDSAAIDELWTDLRDSNVAASMDVYNRFLDIFMGRNNMDRMQEVLDSMMLHIPPNPVTTTTIIDMLGKMGRLNEMEALLEEMSNSPDMAPTLVTYHQVMTAYARTGDVGKVESIRARLIQDNLEENHVTYNILFDAYGRAKRFEHVGELVAERASRQIPMEEMGYLVLLNIYGRAKMGPEVDDLVEQVLSQERMDMTARLLGGISTAYSFIGDNEKVGKYIELLLRHPNCKQRDIEGVFLTYSKMRDIPKLTELLKRFPPTEFIFNICVAAFAKENEHGMVAQLLEQMELKNMALTTNTSITLSTLLLKAGKTDLAHAVLRWKRPDADGGAN